MYSLCQEPSLNEIAANITDQLEHLDLPPGIPPVNISNIPSIDDGDRILREKCVKNTKNETYADNLMVSLVLNIVQGVKVKF